MAPSVPVVQASPNSSRPLAARPGENPADTAVRLAGSIASRHSNDLPLSIGRAQIEAGQRLAALAGVNTVEVSPVLRIEDGRYTALFYARVADIDHPGMSIEAHEPTLSAVVAMVEQGWLNLRRMQPPCDATGSIPGDGPVGRIGPAQITAGVNGECADSTNGKPASGPMPSGASVAQASTPTAAPAGDARTTERGFAYTGELVARDFAGISPTPPDPLRADPFATDPEEAAQADQELTEAAIAEDEREKRHILEDLQRDDEIDLAERFKLADLRRQDAGTFSLEEINDPKCPYGAVCAECGDEKGDHITIAGSEKVRCMTPRERREQRDHEMANDRLDADRGRIG